MDQNPYESPIGPGKQLAAARSKASLIVPLAFVWPTLLVAVYCFYGAWRYVGSLEQNDHPFVQAHLHVAITMLIGSAVIYGIGFGLIRFLQGRD